MPKLTESDLDAAIGDRKPWPCDISPLTLVADKLDAHLHGHVYRSEGRRPLTLVSPDPMNNFGGPETEPFERDHAPLYLHGVPVQPMPAEASSELLADKPRKPWLTPAGRLWVPYLLIVALWRHLVVDAALKAAIRAALFLVLLAVLSAAAGYLYANWKGSL